jgi:hypothetical protein
MNEIMASPDLASSLGNFAAAATTPGTFQLSRFCSLWCDCFLQARHVYTQDFLLVMVHISLHAWQIFMSI